MYKPVSIKPATVRDLTYVASHLNADDEKEIKALTNVDLREIAAQHLGEFAFVAWVKGKPVIAFGLAPYMGSTWAAWMFGTQSNWRAVPAVTEFSRWLVGHVAETHGARRLEARSHIEHKKAHSWLTSALGCGEPVPLPSFGLDGETFYLFSKEIGHVHQYT